MNIFRSFWKKTLKNPMFWEYFPEYNYLKLDLETGKIKLSCCSMPKDTVKTLSDLILNNPEKWKLYLKKDKLNVFDGTKIFTV